MNLDIKKQCDLELIYEGHSYMRSDERNVPRPKYIPLNAVFMGRDYRDDKETYTIQYEFRGKKYIMIVEDYTMVVRTVYQLNTSYNIGQFISTLPSQKYKHKKAQRSMRQNKSEEYFLIKEGKYKHMEWEVGYSQCA
jgi:hypothetical protein